MYLYAKIMVLNVYMQFLKQEKVHSKWTMITSGEVGFQELKKKTKHLCSEIIAQIIHLN